jgi:AraC-like DNA-binding protein
MQLRVQVARRHLAQGRAIAEVALLTGFADQSHLTRAFVRQVGITPGRYRAAMHGDP